MLKLIVIEGETEDFGKCIYDENEFALEYKIDYPGTSAGFLLIYHTFEIVFDIVNKKFISLDAYINKKLWKHQAKIKVSEIYKTGVLKILDGFEDTDRYSFSYDPKYEYSEEGLLKIKLSDDSDSLFYKIAKDLIVGINNEQITSFILLKIHFS